MSQADDNTQPPQPPEHILSKEDAIRWMLDTCALNHKEARTKRSTPQRVYLGLGQFAPGQFALLFLELFFEGFGFHFIPFVLSSEP